jgi:hypothetical protein
MLPAFQEVPAASRMTARVMRRGVSLAAMDPTLRV